MIDPKVLRIGNWIHCKGSSHYGVVTGEILAQMERDKRFREKFQYVILDRELLEAAGYVESNDKYGGWIQSTGNYRNRVMIDHSGFLWQLSNKQVRLDYLDQLQNLTFILTGSELLLPESAKRINLAVAKLKARDKKLRP